MKTIIQLILILLLSASLAGQGEIMKFEKGESMVISTTGLNLREKPTIQSKVIAKIPFAEKVEIIEKVFYGIDTIGSYKVYEDDSNKEHILQVIGNWVKVDYKGTKGFLYDAYLYRSFQQDWTEINEVAETNLNKEFVLLFPGTYCNYNFWYNREMTWYGVYELKNHFALKQIELSFFKDWHGDMSDMGITTNNNKNLLFVIGAKKGIREGVIKGTSYGKHRGSGFELVTAIEKENETNKIILKDNDSSQILNFYNGQYLYQAIMVWEGDLDSDGKLDYIIRYGEKSARTILYLSSKAESGKLVKPVAVFFSGYCC